MAEQLTPLAAGQHVSVHVPATSANLGPGFDSLGLALTLHDTLSLETFDDGRLAFDVRGEGAEDVPQDASHLCVRAIDSFLASVGFARVGLSVTAENAIPHGRGLGSSAAAIVSGILAANALLPEDARRSARELFEFAAAMEGHPDNVAPAQYGGLAISWSQEGAFRTVTFAPDASVIPIVAIPQFTLSTELARGMLPAQVPHKDAAANSGRTALLIHAVREAPELLLPATEDLLHQHYRAPAMEASAELVRTLRAAEIAAMVSGAGPTVLALTVGAEQAARAEKIMAGTAAADNAGNAASGLWRVLRLNVDADGAKVEVHRRK